MVKRLSCGIAVVSVAVITLFWCYRNGFLRCNYPDPSEFPVMGIDVSHHQGYIDWKGVAGSGVQFVFVKATEGCDYRDPEFGRNWKGAADAGLPRGAYHFYRLSGKGREQARNFLDAVPEDAAELPSVVDFESVDNRPDGQQREEIIRELADFIRCVESARKRPVLIYTTYEAYRKYLAGSRVGNEIWFRNIFRRPVLPDGRSWLFWQYANNGRIAGITGPVDLNVYCGSPDRFRSYCRR